MRLRGLFLRVDLIADRDFSIYAIGVVTSVETTSATDTQPKRRMGREVGPAQPGSQTISRASGAHCGATNRTSGLHSAMPKNDPPAAQDGKSRGGRRACSANRDRRGYRRTWRPLLRRS